MFGWAAPRRVQRLEAELAAISRSQAMIEFTLDGKIVTANDNFLRTMGYTLGEIAGQHHSLFVPDDERGSAAYRQFWEQLGRGEFCAAMFKRLAKGGREVWLQASYNPILDETGRPTRVIKIAADVTREQMVSADHAGQVAAMQRALASIEFGMDGTILGANGNFLAIMGYDAAELVGRARDVLLPEKERNGQADRDFWAGLRGGGFHSGEFKRIAKDGGEVWFNATYNAILDPSGRPFKVVSFGNNVTRERLESANNKGQIDAINRAQAVIEFKLDGTILDANENFLRATGYSLAELRGQHHAMLVERSERESADYRAFWAALGAGEFRAGEYRRIRKDGSILWLRATYNAIYDLNGRPFKVVKFAVDVTDQVVAREGFSNLIDNVAGAARQLSHSITEISAAMVRSQESAGAAVQRVANADDAAQRLNRAAQAMGRVADLIGSITQQINLLALNATIESARAGDAGRGFAVVANEVKILANQAKVATEQIGTEIDGIRAISSDVVGALSAIKEAIGAVSVFVTSTTEAVEAQSTVTEGISANMQSAAEQAGRLWAA